MVWKRGPIMTCSVYSCLESCPSPVLNDYYSWWAQSVVLLQIRSCQWPAWERRAGGWWCRFQCRLARTSPALCKLAWIIRKGLSTNWEPSFQFVLTGLTGITGWLVISCLRLCSARRMPCLACSPSLTPGANISPVKTCKLWWSRHQHHHQHQHHQCNWNGNSNLSPPCKE